MVPTHRLFPLACIVLMLAGCGGSKSGKLLLTVPPPPDAAVGGIWDGTATNDLEPGFVTRIIGLIAEDGRAQYFEVNSNTGRPDFNAIGLSFAGLITSLIDEISGNIRIYAPVGATFTGGQTAVTGTLVGAIVEGASIEGVWTAQTGDSGDFSQLFSALYDRDSSLALTDAAWVGKTSIQGANLALTINAQGTIVGGIDDNACIYDSLAGDGIVLIDPEFNMYEVSLKITNCGPLNGIYPGLAYLSDRFVLDDNALLTISVSNASTAILIELARS